MTPIVKKNVEVWDFLAYMFNIKSLTFERLICKFGSMTRTDAYTFLVGSEEKYRRISHMFQEV